MVRVLAIGKCIRGQVIITKSEGDGINKKRR